MESTGANTIAKAVRKAGLNGRDAKKLRPITTVANSPQQNAANFLNQEFYATGPGQRRVTGITFLPPSTGWAYFAAVLGLYSRKVVRYAISDGLTTTLISEAASQSIDKSRPAWHLLYHRDRGCQDPSEAIQ